MGGLDKVISAVTPEASDEDRMEARARARARALAGTSGWLAMALDHPETIEAALATVKKATSAGAQRSAQKALALVLNGHSLAQEVVLYPATALTDQKARRQRHAVEAHAALPRGVRALRIHQQQVSEPWPMT